MLARRALVRGSRQRVPFEAWAAGLIRSVRHIGAHRADLRMTSTTRPRRHRLRAEPRMLDTKNRHALGSLVSPRRHHPRATRDLRAHDRSLERPPGGLPTVCRQQHPVDALRVRPYGQPRSVPIAARIRRIGRCLRRVSHRYPQPRRRLWKLVHGRRGQRRPRRLWPSRRGSADKDDVAVAADPNGRLWVLWAQKYGSRTAVYARRSNPAATVFGAPVKIVVPTGVSSVWHLAATPRRPESTCWRTWTKRPAPPPGTRSCWPGSTSRSPNRRLRPARGTRWS